MIDEPIGDMGNVKIAENKEEKFWLDFKERCVNGILTAEREIEINEWLLRMSDKKLEKLKAKGNI